MADSTHHVSFAAGDVTKVVVPLFAQDGWAPHQRDNLLVFCTSWVFKIPELDVSEKRENAFSDATKYTKILIRKVCLSPVSCRDKVGPILREANCLYFCGYFVACDLEQLPFIENWCCHWNHGISGWECPQAGYGLSSVSLGSNLKSAPLPSYLIFVSPDRILTPVMNVSPLGPWLRCI